MLVAHSGKLVTRDEIRNALWPNGTVVEFEHSISAAMKRLRQVLGDSVEQPRYIETLARRGYRWKAPVEWVEATPAAPRGPIGTPLGEESSASNRIGRKVSHYRVLGVLGGGGMGVVYKAEDLKLGRQVAIKFLPEELANEPKALERFEREARAASALDHPNICSIHEFGEHEGQPFIVMQLLEGQTLRERIGVDSQHAKPLPTKELLDLAVQITRGLEAAHHKGIIHRDIKPANIFVTNRGEAKVLDFGVARLTAEQALPNPSITSGPIRVASLNDSERPTVSSFTLTGANVGTAGYMSPEQILGEKLDERSDLFSFGLVLYDMATGQHAFAAETAELVRVAVLHRPVQPAREINPELPPALEKVIAKTLEKSCQTRYQHASEIRADLEALRVKEEHGPASRWRELAAGAFTLLMIASVIFWFSRRHQPSAQTQPELKLEQLTVNSFENRVTSGAISPDGKYLAYTDVNGMNIKLIETGETRSVPLPAGFKNENVEWEIVCSAWFPDGTRFVANAHPPAQKADLSRTEDSSIWIVSVLGGPPTKIRDNATAYSVARVASEVSFGTNRGKFGDREIWLMKPSGEQARKIFDTDKSSSISGGTWSPDGRRIIYVKTDNSGHSLVSRDLNGLVTTILRPSEMKGVIGSGFWLADGRLIYSVEEPESLFESACNLWEIRLDGRNGTPIDKPKQLTSWSGFCTSNTSVTADGKRLSFLKRLNHLASYVGDLPKNGRSVVNLRHFPLTESSDAVLGWTADSRVTILSSNQGGHSGLYKQALDENTVEPLLTEGFGRDARVTPDGQNIIYLGPTDEGSQIGGPQPVMRVRLTGGPSHLLFKARDLSLLMCARSPATLCVIAEPTEDRKQEIFTGLDPLKGRGPELARFALDPNDDRWFSDLSPDGTRIAAIRSPAGPIYLLSLRGQPTQEIHVKGWSNLSEFIWAADGKSLYVTAVEHNRRIILHVDLLGNANVFWQTLGDSGEVLAYPSPDGRKLALQAWTTSGNMWMMENF
jgi:serine/threonine protein kinase